MEVRSDEAVLEVDGSGCFFRPKEQYLYPLIYSLDNQEDYAVLVDVGFKGIITSKRYIPFEINKKN